jgi:hypothetical protein
MAYSSRSTSLELVSGGRREWIERGTLEELLEEERAWCAQRVRRIKDSVALEEVEVVVDVEGLPEGGGCRWMSTSLVRGGACIIVRVASWF